jgi:hypothetical protein
MGNVQRDLLAENLKAQWSCRLTAFLKPAPPMFTLCPRELEREAKEFAEYARREATDPAVARYQNTLGMLRTVGGNVFGNAKCIDFMTTEHQAQKALVTETLHRVREAWLELQRT